MYKKPTLVETPLPPEFVATPPVVKAMIENKLSAALTAPVQESVAADPRPKDMPDVVPPVTMADLMLELEIIGEVFKKRKIFSVQSLKFENGKFRLTCSWQPEKEGEMKRYIGRSISSSLTAKGLALVIEELKAAAGI